MFYHLLYPLSGHYPLFNLVKYITVRSGLSFLTSFVLMFVFWKFIKKYLEKFQFTETVDMYGNSGLESLHKSKEGTPTMGGLLIIGSVLVSGLLWTRLNVGYTWYVLLIMVLLGSLGFADDFLKVKKGKGLSRSEKLVSQIIIGCAVGLVICLNKNISTVIDLPFLKRVQIDLGYFYMFWGSLVIVATSNAVNFTDGLDGLAIGGVICSSLVFAILAYLSGHIKFSQYLFIPYINNVGELTVICAALLGAGLGFLWFNSHPAEIFMGDTGALALGGILGAIALLIKKEFLLFIAGGIFVLEALSVVLQILSLRLCGKRVFKAAPLHHHFQLMGWPESKIIVRFWIISILFAACSLLTLKLR